MQFWLLDVGQLKLLGSLLHAGAYRSAAAYFAAVKRAHITSGGEWSPQMAQEVRDGTRSCTRGQGPDKQSAEVDLDDLAAFNGGTKKKNSKWPVAGKDVVLTMCYWMLREVEGGTARLVDVQILEGAGCGRACWNLPCRKTDVRAFGASASARVLVP